MARAPKKLAFTTNTASGDSVTWLHPNDADSVQAISTRYGPRLVLSMRDSGKEVWLVDTDDARRKLGLELAA
jgi:hypothetical protein